jgi:hypothetical protein
MAPVLHAITMPMLSFLMLPNPRPRATDEALAAWCAAALRAGALPALRRLMALPRRDRGAPIVRMEAASAASLLALLAAEPLAASDSAAAGGASADGMPEGLAGSWLGWLASLAGFGLTQTRRPVEAPRWRDDPAVRTALEILLGCVTGAPAWGALAGLHQALRARRRC